MEIVPKSVIVCKQHNDAEFNDAYAKYETERTKSYQFALANAKYILGVQTNPEEQEILGLKQHENH
jgi:hypothetical protein